MAGLRTLLKPNEAVKIVGISPDTTGQSKAVAEQVIASDGRGAFKAPLLSDTGSRVIEAYGVKDERYSRIRSQGIPQPAIYLVDKAGKVAWSRLGAHVSNADIRAAIDALR